MTIVCGTDFSARAVQAVEVAAAICARLREPFKLVYAVDRVDSVFVFGGALSSDDTPLRAALRRDAEALRAQGVDAEDMVLAGSADEVLVDVARRFQARLVVVASLGRRAQSR